MKFTTFEDIEAWQAARTLTRLVRRFARRAQEKHDWTWADQISRAALSIMANIAEGNDAQSNKEFAKFLGYSKRSGAEVRSHLYYGLDESYLSPEEFAIAVDLTKKICAQLAKLIAYLRKNSGQKNKTSNEQTS